MYKIPFEQRSHNTQVLDGRGGGVDAAAGEGLSQEDASL